jgi:hypothetical protein
MEPKKFNHKFNNISYSFTVPINAYHFPKYKKETVEEMIERLDAGDAVVDVMNSYPTAEKMLNELYGKA